MVSAACDKPDTIYALVEMGADVNVATTTGWTALDFAFDANSSANVLALLEKRADARGIFCKAALQARTKP